jgi:acetyl esterase/lipase
LRVRRIHLAITLLLTGTAGACAHNQPARRMIAYSELTAATVTPADQRIAYGADPLQFGELRLPSGRDSVPLVVFIHGGCWRAQYDLQHVAPAAAALVQDGIATWTVEYRRIGDAGGGWPGTFDDISHAVDYVRALAARFPRIDTTRVVLMGHSAGGQLALWAASRKQNELTGLFRSSVAPLHVAGVVSLAGIADLVAFGATPGSCNANVPLLLGGSPQEQRDRYRAVDPSERVPIGVPIRLVHGEADPIVPVAQSREFLSRARTALDTVQLDVVPGAGHFDLLAPQAEAWPVVVRAVRALLARPAPPPVHTGD